jgi:hypothetical protein
MLFNHLLRRLKRYIRMLHLNINLLLVFGTAKIVLFEYIQEIFFDCNLDVLDQKYDSQAFCRWW